MHQAMSIHSAQRRMASYSVTHLFLISEHSGSKIKKKKKKEGKSKMCTEKFCNKNRIIQDNTP